MAKKVLVVDDEEAISTLVKEMLSSEGINVIGASSGREAIEIVKKEEPDFIFLDLLMPEMSGWETLKEIRKITQAPVAMFTILPLTDNIEKEEIDEVVDYITKPFSKRDLIETLKQVPGFFD